MRRILEPTVIPEATRYSLLYKYSRRQFLEAFARVSSGQSWSPSDIEYISVVRFKATVMREIFCPSAGLASNYPTMLRHLYSINDLLKKDGISAPSDASLTNTSRLYDLIGRPLDKIPTLHVGGTNGKVSNQSTVMIVTVILCTLSSL